MAKESILIVADEHEVVNQITGMLDGYGYDILWAPNTTRLQDMIKVRDFSVVVVDQWLNGKNEGMEVVRNIRTSTRNAKVNVMVITSTASTDTITQAKELGVAAFLLRPLDASRLRKALSRAVSTGTMKSVVPD